MADEDDTREQGIEFGDLAAELEAESYPLSHETLLSRYGDHELELVDGRVTVREVLSEESDEEYEDTESVQQAILNMVGGEAIGREGYSDRGGTAENAEDPEESESF